MHRISLLAMIGLVVSTGVLKGQAPAAPAIATNSDTGAKAAPAEVTPPPTAGPLSATATLPEAQWESQVVTSYRNEYVTRVETVPQKMIQPVVKYHLERPFFGGQPQWVARTYYEPRTMTVAVPRTYQTLVPQTQVVRRPVSATPATQFAARPSAPTQVAARPRANSLFDSSANSQPVFVPPASVAQGSIAQRPSMGPAYSHQPMPANQPIYVQQQPAVAAAPLLWSAPAHTASTAPTYRSANANFLPIPSNAAPYGRADLSGYGSVSTMDGDPPRYGVRSPQYGNQIR